MKAKYTCMTKSTATVLVVKNDGCPENQAFFTGNPVGHILLSDLSPEASAMLIPGKDYWLDISPIEA